MIGEIILIWRLNREKPLARTEEDRRREAQYGIYFEDVTGYIFFNKYTIATDREKLRAALDDDAYWIKTKELIRVGELKSENPEAILKKTIRPLRVHGAIRIFLGLGITLGAVYTKTPTSAIYWGSIALGFFFILSGWVRGWSLPKALARRQREAMMSRTDRD